MYNYGKEGEILAQNVSHKTAYASFGTHRPFTDSLFGAFGFLYGRTERYVDPRYFRS